MNDYKITIEQITENNFDDALILVKQYLKFYKRDAESIRIETFMAERLKNKQSVLLVACDQNDSNQALGFAHLYPMFSTLSLGKVWVLNDLFVTKQSRGMKIGQQLIDKAVKFAKSDGAFKLTLKTEHDNLPAKTLYEKYGFERDSTYVNYYLKL